MSRASLVRRCVLILLLGKNVTDDVQVLDEIFLQTVESEHFESRDHHLVTIVDELMEPCSIRYADLGVDAESSHDAVLLLQEDVFGLLILRWIHVDLNLRLFFFLFLLFGFFTLSNQRVVVVLWLF